MARTRSAVLLCALLLCGCGGAIPVSGTVTFDGTPLPEGDIVFHDADKKVGPDAGKIKDGKYSFPVKAGKKKVEINASRLEKLPEGKKGAMGETELPVDYIPERYNKNSELTAEVGSGKSKFDFALKSK